ncbi:M13 family metallopeptidase [Nigerium massiliense]|uniref:M13 family metallopeptidase n=1 Tax=Nigerium massiliense TaxID=1522317 RepID=UPI00058B0871|nr:M13 family metallopeptidase [Nigerium massiliense]
MSTFDTEPAVRPADDLYRHTNGRWLQATQIPADKGRYGVFHRLHDNAEADVRDLITELGEGSPEPGTDAARVGNMFASFMDTEQIERAGLDWLGLERIESLDSVDELTSYLGWCLRSGVTSLLSVGVDADPGDPQHYRLFLSQDGIGLPDEEYYRLEEHADIRRAYLRLIERLLQFAGDDPAAAHAVLDLETRIAALHWDKVRCRDLVASYNPVDQADLGWPWDAILLAAAADGVGGLVLSQPSFFKGVPELLNAVDLGVWRSWARFHLVKDRAFALPGAVYDAWFDFYGKTLQGIPEQRERWKRGVQVVQRYLGEIVGKLYVERHFPADAKQQVGVLVDRLLQAYGESIRSLEWMGEQTRAEALEKLANFTPKIGYPDRWQDYSALTVEPGDLLGNVERASEFHFDEDIAKASGPVRDWEWLMTPQTVNAYYHPLRNEIVFPAAILQPPFFDPDADDAENFGSIGAVIGHEIGHGFDDQGSTCDGQGRLRNWWTDDDRAAFTARTNRLVDQYSALSPAQLPGRHLNGQLTLGENIGDLGGLAIAHRAWELSRGAAGDGAEASTEGDGATGARVEDVDRPGAAGLPENPAPSNLAATSEPSPQAEASGQAEPNLEQRFFLSWARAWAEKVRDEALSEQIATDPHSPAEFRCNQVVANIDAFYDAFGVRESDGLWLDPADRVRIW